MEKHQIAREDSPNSSRQTIKIKRADLEKAASEGVITEVQAYNLWNSLTAAQPQRAGAFDFANLAWYSGTVLVMLAMAWFMAEVWNLYSGGAIFMTSIAYAALFLLAGNNLWKKEELKIPGGLLITLAVTMAPFAIYSLERITGLSGLSDTSQRLLMEGGTLAAGLAALAFYRFPFLTAPISIGLWITSMDLINSYVSLSWEQERILTMSFGLIMIVGSYMVDRLSREDFAYWGYLVGATALWAGLTFTDSGGELGKFGYFAINVGLMLLSVLLGRKIFVVYGAMGVIYYLGHLISLFADTTLFPVALTFVGLAIIYGGISYQRNRQKIESAILSLVPQRLRAWLPAPRS